MNDATLPRTPGPSLTTSLSWPGIMRLGLVQASLGAIVVLMTAVTGQAPTYTAGAWVWSGVDHAGPAIEPTPGQLARSAAGPASGTVASVEASAACVLAPPAP